MTTLVWFRSDLRLADNPALTAAASRGPVIPVYVWSPDEEDSWPPGAASRWWLHHSLSALERALERQGSLLVIRRGPADEALAGLMDETGADAVFWNRRYEPAAVAREAQLKRSLPGPQSFNGALLHTPWTVVTGSGTPYQVFTPFWRRLRSMEPPQAPLPPPRLARPPRGPRSLRPLDLGLLPGSDWDGGLAACWTPGEAGAGEALDAFAERSARYADDRDLPARPSSRLSPHLHHGELSPGQVWHAVTLASGAAAEPYLRQLAWREFAHHLLYHHPASAEQPLRPGYGHMPWRDDPAALAAWRQGRTGYALVDAGMRQLWQTGWMHNRARMVAASFLTKHLLIDWREGARWFWDTLVDADLANNTLGWQWVAGSGADAAPYHRIFSPDRQAQRYDADGGYRDRWLGGGHRTPPIVGHAAARTRALAAYEAVRRSERR
ncbi:MAG TPA: deoxyribodipyrimidine photo-lyase [Gaiellales bacterium]|nr:deoxyribodipyrimidine photo-lyase [Gaiellales bacterium]